MPDRLTSYCVKAGLIACFFLWSAATAQTNTSPSLSWRFEGETALAYRDIYNLQINDALLRLSKIRDGNSFIYKTYLESLAETVDILVTENVQRFVAVEQNFERRLDDLEDAPATADNLFLRAELSLQLGFCYLNMGHELSAILSIRQAYQLTARCRREFPWHVPIRKTEGVIQIMVGAVPDKYHFFMSLLGMEGSVVAGQKLLNELRTSKVSLGTEASILYFAVKGFINQQFGEASTGFTSLLEKDPKNRLLLFLAVNMMMKNYQSETALTLIKTLDDQPAGLPLVYIDYLRAEILMQKGDYAGAISYYQRFMSRYMGTSFHKDASFKIALALHLTGKPEQAKGWWNKARITGKSMAEPDVYAAHMLQSDKMPNEKLLRVRFLTDGGYFQEAEAALSTIQPDKLPSIEDRAEYIYRKARLAHQTSELNKAQSLYLRTIELCGHQPWYFAPSSALQLGYMAKLRGDLVSAKKYFQQALNYRKHAYKNSIDGKAKSALDELNGSKN